MDQTLLVFFNEFVNDIDRSFEFSLIFIWACGRLDENLGVLTNILQEAWWLDAFKDNDPNLGY